MPWPDSNCVSTQPRGPRDASRGNRYAVGASRWPWCSLSPNLLLFIHKGLIWLVVATIAEVLPAVGGWFNITTPPLIMMLQVFICLNLNGKFTLSIFFKEH